MNEMMTMMAMQSADLVAGSKILILMMAAAYCFWSAFAWGTSWSKPPRWLWFLLGQAVLMLALNIAADQWGMPVEVRVTGSVEWK